MAGRMEVLKRQSPILDAIRSGNSKKTFPNRFQ